MFLISFCWGNSPFPLADGLVGQVQRRGKLLLGHPLFSAQLGQKAAKCSLVQFVHIFCLLAGVCRPFSGLIILGRILPRNRRAVESSPLRFFMKKRRTVSCAALRRSISIVRKAEQPDKIAFHSPAEGLLDQALPPEGIKFRTRRPS